MKKFNIATRLDVSKFQHEVYDCLESSDFYIFMSPDTADSLMEIITGDCMIKLEYKNDDRNEMIGMYWGHKIFRDPTMKYGDIEFR